MRKYIFLILLCFSVFYHCAYGNVVTETINGVVLEIHSGSRDITPFLKNEISKWEKYFKKIYAEYNNEHLFIKIYSTGNYLTFNEIKEVIRLFVQDAAIFYPLSDIRITVLPSDSENSWHCIQYQIENGQTILFQEY